MPSPSNDYHINPDLWGRSQFTLTAPPGREPTRDWPLVQFVGVESDLADAHTFSHLHSLRVGRVEAALILRVCRLDSLQGHSAVIRDRPAGVVAHLPAVAIRVGEVAVVTTERRTLRLFDDRCSCRAGPLHGLVDFGGRPRFWARAKGVPAASRFVRPGPPGRHTKP